MIEAILFLIWSIFLIEVSYYLGKKTGWVQGRLNAIADYIKTRNMFDLHFDLEMIKKLRSKKKDGNK